VQTTTDEMTSNLPDNNYQWSIKPSLHCYLQFVISYNLVITVYHINT